MSILPWWRSRRADPRGRRGQSLVLALMLVLFALPVGVTFYQFVGHTLKNSIQESRQKTAAQMADGVLTDYMRAFSQDAYNGHYDVSNLSRDELFYSQGYSTVTFIPDEINRTVYLKAEGNYGTATDRKARKVVEALVQFQSDLTQYGTMVNGPFTISASGVTYLGGMWINGNLTVTGTNVLFNGGPLVVMGNVTAPSSVALDGDLYYSGASAGSLTVNGTRYNFVPSSTWPTLDFNYYDAHYTYKTTASATIVFNSTGTFTVVNGPTLAIPAQGAIIYGENCNLTIRGIVSGRVTVVAGGTIGSGTQGNITVSDNVYYAGASSITASALYSFAALARNRITFSKAAGNLLVAGVYFVEQGTSNMTLSGAVAATFWLYGVRTQGISISGGAFANGRNLTYDSALRAYPPPGLPERALLVNYNAR